MFEKIICVEEFTCVKTVYFIGKALCPRQSFPGNQKMNLTVCVLAEARNSPEVNNLCFR